VKRLNGNNREREVDRLGHAEIAWQQCIHVPEDKAMNENVDHQHDVDVSHRELVVFVQRLQQVIPPDPGAC